MQIPHNSMALEAGEMLHSGPLEASPGMQMMRMYFHFGYGENFLFKQLVIDTPIKMILCCTSLFVMAVLYEGLRYLGSIRCQCERSPHCQSDECGREVAKEPLAAKNNSTADKHDNAGEPNGAGKRGNDVTSSIRSHRSQPMKPGSTSGVSSASQSADCNSLRRAENESALVRYCREAVSRPDHRAFRPVQTTLYTITTMLSFVLMLASMTFNLCLIFAVVSGAGVGYYIFFPTGDGIRGDYICH